MKKTMLRTTALMILILAFALLSACTFHIGEKDIWGDADYTEDTSLGQGATEIKVEVKAGEHSVTFTLHTDKNTLADALTEHQLIEGDEGEYGLYIKKVNGIKADFEADGSWWGLYQNGEALMTGASDTEITDGAHYELVKE